MEIKGYITNSGRYTEGELVGKWITFPIDDEELEQVLEEIGINDKYEEYCFTDWECDFEHNFGEYESVEELNEIAEQIEEWDEDTFNAACENWGVKYIIDADPDDYTLYSDINDDYDLGYYWAVDSGCYDLSSMGSLANYFDYESFGRDIRFETDGGFTSYGWIEYRG
jgi:antirestriction protein